MDIKQLESFVCIARMGSMTSASEVLYLSTPALAQQITRLERNLGRQLGRLALLYVRSKGATAAEVEMPIAFGQGERLRLVRGEIGGSKHVCSPLDGTQFASATDAYRRRIARKNFGQKARPQLTNLRHSRIGSHAVRVGEVVILLRTWFGSAAVVIRRTIRLRG